MSAIRPIAIYLPQFHPIPENDEWWGKGFTEWSSVTKSKPLFEGHYQPQLPADLGFYDLRLPEVREEQAKLAKQYGIYGFCYYHYWFNGRRILERPFMEVFESGKPDFPFMLCWANENWTRAWDGGDKEILLQQHYNEEDDRNHIKYLIPYFKDSRYIKINNKPVFIIYKSAELPNVKRTLEIWREEAAKEGLELYLCRMERWNSPNGKEVLNQGFDAGVDFQPLSQSLREYLEHEERNKPIAPKIKLRHRIKNRFIKSFTFPKKKQPAPSDKEQPFMSIINLEKYVDFDLHRPVTDYKIFPGVSPSWDNSPRRKNGQIIFQHASPKLYGKWLRGKIEQFKPYSEDENFIFINAWNEWAESNHLEPCQKWGRGFLEATKKEIDALNERH